MSGESDALWGLLERRLLLLRALAEQLIACRKEFVAMDLDGMYGRIAEQENLCRQIQMTKPFLDLRERAFKGLPQDAASVSRMKNLLRDLREAQAEVFRLNRIQAAYLRRAERTIQVLLNACGSCSLSYASAVQPLPASARVTGS